MKNPAKRAMDRICRPSTVPSKLRKLKDIASYREELKSVSDAEKGTEKVVLSEDNEEE